MTSSRSLRPICNKNIFFRLGTLEYEICETSISKKCNIGKLKELMPGLDGTEIVLPKYPEKLLFQQYFAKKSEDITTSKYGRHPKHHTSRQHLLVNVNHIYSFINQPENHYLQKQFLQYKIYFTFK